MILEIVGAGILIAAFIVLIRIEAGIHKTSEALEGMVRLFETDRQADRQKGTPGSAGNVRPSSQGDRFASEASASVGPAGGRAARPEAEIAVAVAAARLAQAHLAQARISQAQIAARSGRNMILTGCGTGQTPGTPSSLDAVSPNTSSLDTASSAAGGAARPAHHHAYDGLGSGFVDVIGSEPTTRQGEPR